jgi:hypothetical protein
MVAAAASPRSVLEMAVLMAWASAPVLDFYSTLGETKGF